MKGKNTICLQEWMLSFNLPPSPSFLGLACFPEHYWARTQQSFISRHLSCRGEAGSWPCSTKYGTQWLAGQLGPASWPSSACWSGRRHSERVKACGMPWVRCMEVLSKYFLWSHRADEILHIFKSVDAPFQHHTHWWYTFVWEVNFLLSTKQASLWRTCQSLQCN